MSSKPAELIELSVNLVNFKAYSASCVVRISPPYRGRNGCLVPIGHKGRFLPFENSKKQNDKW